MCLIVPLYFLHKNHLERTANDDDIQQSVLIIMVRTSQTSKQRRTTNSRLSSEYILQRFFPLTGGCSEGLGAFRFFFRHHRENILGMEHSVAIDLRPRAADQCPYISDHIIYNILRCECSTL